MSARSAIPAVCAWLVSCGGATVASDEAPERQAEGVTLAGADLSEAWFAQQAGADFKDTDGTPGDPFEILHAHGYSIARIRVNVSPPDAPRYAMFTDVEYGVRSAERARDAGMETLLNLHYSHWWADPANQWRPPDWPNDPERLAARVSAWTEHTLRAFIDSGIDPKTVQIGNEITNGMLWNPGGPYRSGGSWRALANLVNAGIEGVQRSGSRARIMIHLETTGDEGATEGWIEAFTAHGGRWDLVDVLGLSYYPMWHGRPSDLERTLSSVRASFPGVELSIVETAYFWEDIDSEYPGISFPEPFSRSGQAAFLRTVRAIAERQGAESVMYWGTAWTQPERWLDAPGWTNTYDVARRALFDDEGRLLPAADALTRSTH